jgi:hypothetical protein
VLCNANVAVDALMLKCTMIDSLQGRLLRCGFKKYVSDEIVNMGLFAEGDLASKRLDSYGNPPGSNSNTSDLLVQDQIRSKQIIFTTIHFASKEKGRSEDAGYWDFSALVLDEAAQIEDSRLLIVLARCHSLKKMILVGDPKQLQPYVSNSLRDQGYGKSSMERLMESSSSSSFATGQVADASTPYVMLEVQHRLAPSLRQIVSHLYYNNRLQDAPVVLQRGPVKTVKLQPLLVVNVVGATKTFSRLHQSYENKGEAMVVKAIHNFLLGSEFDVALSEDVGELTCKDVCILTPYNRHKDRLRMLICDLEDEDLDRYAGQTYGNTDLASPTKSQALYGTQDQVSEDWAAIAENIDTVDKFQGSERKVVIISTCVDCNPLRAADPHFINVASSRAQHLLVVVGNFSHALASNDDWRYIWQQAREHGSYIEHQVTETLESVPGEETQQKIIDIHEKAFVRKLRDLMERPSQRRK